MCACNRVKIWFLRIFSEFQDVTFNGTYIRHGSKSFLAKLEATYSPQTQKKLTIESKIQDLSDSDSVKYKLDVLAQHPATKLDLVAAAEYFGGGGIYQATCDAKYRRSFLGLQHGTFDGKINANDKEIDFRVRLVVMIPLSSGYPV